MSHYIESTVGDNGKILIEVEEAGGGVGFGVRPSKNQETPQNAFNLALNAIQLTASSVLETLNTLEEKPSSAKVDFAIKFDAEVGPMLAKSNSDAQLRVSLSWNTTPSETDKEAEK